MILSSSGLTTVISPVVALILAFSFEVAVNSTLPGASNVTTPVLLIVATVASDDDQLTILFVAFAGVTVAVNVNSVPST